MYQSFGQEDTGNFYCLEQGVLYTPKGPYEATNLSIFGRGKATGDFCPVNLKDGGSLLGMCVAFIARNCDKVDSLEGIPAHIGERIFDFIYEDGVFTSKSHEWFVNVSHLFNKAYPQHLLVSLDVSHAKSLLRKRQYELLAVLEFSMLRAIDLSGNFITDDCLILKQAFSQPRVEVLILKDNNITREGLAKLTLPIRTGVVKTPFSLKIIDLSGNKGVTSRGLRYLHAFPKLKAVRVSLNHLDQISKELKEYATKTGFWICTDSKHQRCLSSIKQEGWASKLIADWKGKDACSSNAANCPSSAGQFYKSKREANDQSLRLNAISDVTFSNTADYSPCECSQGTLTSAVESAEEVPNRKRRKGIHRLLAEKTKSKTRNKRCHANGVSVASQEHDFDDALYDLYRSDKNATVSSSAANSLSWWT